MVNEIADVKDWEQLAISLGLTTNDIDMIKQYDHREHRQRLVEMWYDRDQDYSWTKLRREVDKFTLDESQIHPSLVHLPRLIALRLVSSTVCLSRGRLH